MIRLNKANFAIAAIAAVPGDGVPPASTGILVSPHETIVTDGKCFIKCSGVEQEATLFDPPDIDAAEAWTPFILDREAALKVAKAFPRHKAGQPDPVALIDCKTESGEAAIVQVGDESLDEILRSRKVPGNYPNVDSVLSDADPAIEILISAHLLVGVLKQMIGMGAVAVRLKLTSAKGVVVIETDSSRSDQKMTAGVMPMHR